MASVSFIPCGSSGSSPEHVELLWDGLTGALALIAAGDRLVLEALALSLAVSVKAVAIAALIGLPLGTKLALSRSRGAAACATLARGLMSLPTVFLGLVCYALFARRGPLGGLDLLYTPSVIVVGELLLALPIITALTHGAVRALDPLASETARTLGASLPRRWFTLLSEARTGVLLAILTAFGRCVTELGIAMMVGGNLSGRTRTLATATALETGRGDFERGMAMSFLLVLIALAVAAAAGWVARERRA